MMPHDTEDCKSPKDHCFFHNEDEPITETSYKVCGECFHVFQKAEELIKEYERVESEINKPGLKIIEFLDPPAKDSVFKTLSIHSCPFCSHDF
jgi:hypothetical protein